jgi:hypothetical protein
MRLGESAGQVDISLVNGTVFRGTIAVIDMANLKLDVNGSLIPIARSVIDKITLVPSKKTEIPTAGGPVEAAGGPFDTVYVINPQTDASGESLEPLVLIGEITRDDATGITIETPQGMQRSMKRDRVIRVNKHSMSAYEIKIKKYAMSLFCPDDMVLVDLPPGKPDRPFFKTCVDRFEYPNIKGQMPQGNASYDDAQKTCESKGKRLCGLEGYTYQYGWQFDKKSCNTKGIGQYEPSGSRYKCTGKFGIYDMTGNIFEWVTDYEGKPMLMGGPFSKCETVSPGLNGEAKPQTGFRCCKSN